MSVGAESGQLRNRVPSAMAAMRWCRMPPGCRARPSGPDAARLKRARPSPVACVVREQGGQASSSRSLRQAQAGIKQALEKLVDPLTRGVLRQAREQSPLRWTCKSRAKLTAALVQAGWRVSSIALR